VESGGVGHPRFIPILTVRRNKHLDLLSGLDEFKVDRQSYLAEILLLVVVLIAGLVPPAANEVS
jgi:hypothetical protein